MPKYLVISTSGNSESNSRIMGRVAFEYLQKQKADVLHRFMKATARGYKYARTHMQDSAQALLALAPPGTFADTGLVTASQEYLSPRYDAPGRKWGLQDAAAWHGYPQFILASNGVDDASGKPIHSLNFDALYTNRFLS